MSEFKVPRKVAEIQQEYQQGCLRLGHLSYQIAALEEDKKILTSQLRDLNLEASAANQAEQKAAADAAQAVVSDNVTPIKTEEG